MFQIAATKKRLICAAGDPYGNRTRVSAVKRFFALISTMFPHFLGLFMSRHIRALRGRGEKQLTVFEFGNGD